jgi:AbrB family looped-hinge helix DNA binding protein
MTIHTKVSAKGQIVIPKDVRDKLAWTQGTSLEVVAGNGGVFLRPVKQCSDESFESFAKRIQKMVGYKGPKITDEMANEAIAQMFRDDPQWAPRH